MNFSFFDASAAAPAAAAQASQATQNAAAAPNPWQWVITIGIWVVVIGAAYFLFIRPQKKRQKAEEELRNSIEIGDDITTIGGIVGRVIAVRDDDETVIIETGSDKTRMRFKKWIPPKSSRRRKRKNRRKKTTRKNKTLKMLLRQTRKKTSNSPLYRKRALAIDKPCLKADRALFCFLSALHKMRYKSFGNVRGSAAQKSLVSCHHIRILIFV